MFQAPRGTADVLPQEQPYWDLVEKTAELCCATFGYHRIRTPVFEHSKLFTRGLNSATDIVEKEMYTFTDRGGDDLTLLPEGTAPVCRAYLEHGMHTLPQPVRLYYFTPIFRYERPQAGRYRQHHQFGIEALGDSNPSIDAEIIDLAWNFLSSLGLRNLSLLINTIGDRSCRPLYVHKLRIYYEPIRQSLCPDCQSRIDRAPLRLLDCKQTSCQVLAVKAPHSLDHLCSECLDHWNQLLHYLKLLNIPFTIDHRLVRGLDYYTRTVFEVQPERQASQTTLLAGGRYDGLMEELGGKSIPGIGFGSGIERIALQLQTLEIPPVINVSRPVVIAPLGEQARNESISLASRLRRENIHVLIAPAGRSMKSQLRYASSLRAEFAIILGDDELAKQLAVIRDMDHGTQREIPYDTLLQTLQTIK